MDLIQFPVNASDFRNTSLLFVQDSWRDFHSLATQKRRIKQHLMPDESTKNEYQPRLNFFEIFLFCNCSVPSQKNPISVINYSQFTAWIIQQHLIFVPNQQSSLKIIPKHSKEINTKIHYLWMWNSNFARNPTNSLILLRDFFFTELGTHPRAVEHFKRKIYNSKFVKSGKKLYWNAFTIRLHFFVCKE